MKSTTRETPRATNNESQRSTSLPKISFSKSQLIPADAPKSAEYPSRICALGQSRLLLNHVRKLCGGLIVASLSKFPVPANGRISQNRLAAAFGVVMMILVTVAMGTVIATVINQSSTISTASIRTGTLAATLAVVLIFLCARGGPRPLLGTLVTLHRSLCLGDIDVALARSQTRIALEGMSVSHVLQEYADKLLEVLRVGSTILDRAGRELKALELASRNAAPQSAEQRRDLTAPVVKSVKECLASYDQLEEEGTKAWRKLENRIRMLGHLAPLGSAEMATFLDDLGTNGR